MRVRRTTKGFIASTVLAVIGAVFAAESSGSAQDGKPVQAEADQAAPAGETPSEETSADASALTEEGVPTEAVEASQAVSEVEEAMEKVEEEIEEGLPAEFTIEFGDTYDWLRLTSGEWLKGELKRMREDDVEFDSDKLDLVQFDW